MLKAMTLYATFHHYLHATNSLNVQKWNRMNYIIALVYKTINVYETAVTINYLIKHSRY